MTDVTSRASGCAIGDTARRIELPTEQVSHGGDEPLRERNRVSGLTAGNPLGVVVCRLPSGLKGVNGLEQILVESSRNDEDLSEEMPCARMGLGMTILFAQRGAGRLEHRVVRRAEGAFLVSPGEGQGSKG